MVAPCSARLKFCTQPNPTTPPAHNLFISEVLRRELAWEFEGAAKL